MNRKLKSGLRYDEVTSADNGAGGDVYVFDGDNARAVRSLINEVLLLKSVEAAANDFTEMNMQVDAALMEAAMEKFFENQLDENEAGTLIGFRG